MARSYKIKRFRPPKTPFAPTHPNHRTWTARTACAMAIAQWEKAIHIDTACRCVDLVGLAIQKREETIIENFGAFYHQNGRLKFSDRRKPNRTVIVPDPFVTTMRAMTGGKRDILKTYATLVFQTLKTGFDMDTPIMTINGFGRFFKQKRKYGFIPKTAKRMHKVMAMWTEDDS